MPPRRRWMWFGAVVELSKLPVGVAYAVGVMAETCHSIVAELHSDLVGHYNYLRDNEQFAADVAATLEQLPE